MYTIHTTEAYIISITARGDADMLMICISDEYGLMYVSIQGARKEASKHRYVAQPYTFVRISCVKGKAGWRLTGIEELDRISRHSVFFPAYTHFTALITKLVHGEESGNLFSILYEGWKSYQQHNIKDADVMLVERIIVLRILHSLGYIGASTMTDICLDSYGLSSDLIEHVRLYQKPITAIINTSIKASGLS